MDKGIEFFEAWTKTQKDILDNTFKTQEIFRNHWLESMKKTQEAFQTAASSFDNPQSKEALKLFNTWFEGVISTTSLYNEEVVKLQQTWEKTLDVQLTQSKDLVKAFTDFLNAQNPPDKG